MTLEEKRVKYQPKPYALYENGTFIDSFSSHKSAKAAKHRMIIEASADMLDLDYTIKPKR